MINRLYFWIPTLLLFSIWQNAISQTNIKVVLHSQFGNGPFYGVSSFLELKKKDLYKYPSQGISKSIVKRFSFQKEKQFYEDYTQGLMTKEEFEKLFIRYPKLTFFLSNPRKTDYYIDIFIGEININKRVIIADINRNKDFRDDITYYVVGDFSLKTKDVKDKKIINQLPVFEVKYEYDDGFKTKWIKNIVRLNPFKSAGSYGNSIEDELYLMIESYKFKKGTMKIGGQKYLVVASNKLISGDFNQERLEVLIFKEKDYNPKFNNYLIPLKLKEEVKIGNKIFKLSNISLEGDTLYLDKSEVKKIIGIRKDEYIPENLYTNKIERNKYLLIDFWGTWCAPCINNLPELGKLYERLDKSRINLLSVASDSDSIAVEKIIKKYNMSWLKKSENYNDVGFVKTLQVDIFPTIILVSPDGKIIERKSGGQNMTVELNKKLEYLRLIKK